MIAFVFPDILLNAIVTVDASTVFSNVIPDARSVSVFGLPLVPITWFVPPLIIIPLPAGPVESISELVIVAVPEATLIPIVISSSVAVLISLLVNVIAPLNWSPRSIPV